jgi:NAD+ kinase
VTIPRVAFVASDAEAAQLALVELRREYGIIDPDDAEVIVPLGGDGFMLETLHRFVGKGVPIFGMHRGSVGFLMNPYRLEGLADRLATAQPVVLHPLEMTTWDEHGGSAKAIAFNEVSLLRETRQGAKLKISVDGVVRLEELMADGILLSTPLDAQILALTPISAFRPRRWRGALLSHRAKVRIDCLEVDKRPISAVADFTEVRDVSAVEIYEKRDVSVTLLFDHDANLQERIFKEQFLT